MRKLPPYLQFKLQEIAIFGLTFLLAFGAIKFASFARLSPKISDDIPLVVLFTCPLFGCFIVESRGWRTRLTFWLFTTALLVTHLLVFLTLIMHPISLEHWTGRWAFIAGFLGELFLLIVLRNWLLPRNVRTVANTKDRP